MRSHHAPTKHLLERFSHKDRSARLGRAIWVYEKGERPRLSRDLRSECTQQGYFAGAEDGRSESEIDFQFNKKYEIPFNRLLPAIDSNLDIFQSADIKLICAKYVANLLHRSIAARQGLEAMTDKLCSDYRAIANDVVKLRRYAAKISLLTGEPVLLEEVRDTLLEGTKHFSSKNQKTAAYLDDIDRATDKLANEIFSLSWSTIRSPRSPGFFISDTPVISRSVNIFGEVKFGVGIGQTTAEWLLPVSTSVAIRVAQRPRADIFATAEEMTQYNNAQITTMSKRLYGSMYDTWIDSSVQRHGGSSKFYVDVFSTKAPSIEDDEFA